VQASANVDAVALQLPLHRENEGRGPIIVEAAELSTMMEEEDQMMAWRAEPAGRQWLLTRGNAMTALAADKRGWFGG
jgi:hypothetical protein